jgi:hypothetical protein
MDWKSEELMTSTTAAPGIKQLITGCDANAHHILLGSNGTNPSGESLTEYLVSLNPSILNYGNMCDSQ